MIYRLAMTRVGMVGTVLCILTDIMIYRRFVKRLLDVTVRYYKKRTLGSGKYARMGVKT